MQRRNLNLICFVSFKNQNWDTYRLVITNVLTRNGNNFWNFRLGQISHTIFWGAERYWRRGAKCVKITLIVSSLEWITCLFLFMMVEFEKVLYSLDLKMALIFLVTKLFQKGTMFNWVTVLTLTWDATSPNRKRHAWWHKEAATPSTEGNWPPS